MTSEIELCPFAVGVVGHRPNRLPSDLRSLATALRRVLAAIRDEITSRASETQSAGAISKPLPHLCAVSPLAEGADRIFADQALELGFSLRCPMPFPQGEYERDFSPGIALEANSLRRFHRLLERAANTTGLTIIELGGSRLDVEAAYAAAGTAVLDTSDLMVAVWEGTRGSSPAGTEATMEDARRRGIPMVVVGANPPHVAMRASSESPGTPNTIDSNAWRPITLKEICSLVTDAIGRRR